MSIVSSLICIIWHCTTVSSVHRKTSTSLGMQKRFNPWVGKIPLEEEIAIPTSILAWEIPWTVAWRATVHGVAKSQTRLSTQAEKENSTVQLEYRKLVIKKKIRGLLRLKWQQSDSLSPLREILYFLKFLYSCFTIFLCTPLPRVSTVWRYFLENTTWFLKRLKTQSTYLGTSHRSNCDLTQLPQSTLFS